MALRWAVNRAKLWSRFVNPTFSFGRRYYLYYLPPPPPYDPRLRGRYTWPVPDISEEFQRAISAAKFAVMMHNEVKDRNIKFARLVRASAATPGSSYYLIIEGIDEDGDLNVYFALVTNRASECQQSLKDWSRIDTDFEYPYRHALKYKIPACRLPEKRPDYFRMMSKFEQHVGRSHTDQLSDAVEICNIMDMGEALHYALYAAKPLEWVNLEPLWKLLYASRVDIGGTIFYRLFVEAFRENTHELKLYYALVRIYNNEKKLIQWKEVDNWPNNSSVFQVAQGA